MYRSGAPCLAPEELRFACRWWTAQLRTDRPIVFVFFGTSTDFLSLQWNLSFGTVLNLQSICTPHHLSSTFNILYFLRFWTFLASRYESDRRLTQGRSRVLCITFASSFWTSGRRWAAGTVPNSSLARERGWSGVAGLASQQPQCSAVAGGSRIVRLGRTGWSLMVQCQASWRNFCSEDDGRTQIPLGVVWALCC